MRTKSQCKTKSISLKTKLAELKINKIGKLKDFQVRKPKKISGLTLIHGFFDCCFGNSFSLASWAVQISNLIKGSVSKQAVAGRINEKFLNLLKELINISLSKNFKKNRRGILERFENVYLQDSSCLKLPDSLVGSFRGNYSKGEIKSVAKLQVVFNLTHNFFSMLDLTPYSKNDQAASGDIISLLKKGDLVVRDMGYFVIESLWAIKEKKAHFITRLKSNVSVFDYKSGEKIKLGRLLKGRTFVKRKVLVGQEKKMEVTLIAIKTSKRIWEYRKNKLKWDRDKRKKITIEKLNMTGWDIFICSLEDLSAQETKEIYRLRWQIEIIFKSWKSHLNLEKNISVHLKKPGLFCAGIYLTLLMIILMIMPVYRIVIEKMKATISLIKLTRLLTVILPVNNWEVNAKMMEILAYSAVYDKRNRVNLGDKVLKLT